MEKRKNRFWIRLLGIFMLIILSVGEAAATILARARRKWAELK